MSHLIWALVLFVLYSWLVLHQFPVLCWKEHKWAIQFFSGDVLMLTRPGVSSQWSPTAHCFWRIQTISCWSHTAVMDLEEQRARYRDHMHRQANMHQLIYLFFTTAKICKNCGIANVSKWTITLCLIHYTDNHLSAPASMRLRATYSAGRDITQSQPLRFINSLAYVVIPMHRNVTSCGYRYTYFS